MAIAGLGRAFDVVPIAAGVGLNFRAAGGITFICTGADTFTLTVASTFGGSYATPGNIFTYYYQAAATNGTAAWTKQTQAASNAVVQGSADTTAIELLETQLADPSCYVKMTASASGLVMAVFHDLTVQRKPANLVKLSA
jgi:hypothetical protein